MPDALKRRIAPSVPLTLELTDDSGAKFTRSFRLSLDFNAIALIEERTGEVLFGRERQGTIWDKLNARNLSVMLWAAMLASHPEYDDAEGLAVVRSYMDVSSVPAITQAVQEAFIASLPKERQDAIRSTAAASPGESAAPLDPRPAAAPATSTGSKTGRSRGTTSASAAASSGG